MFQFLLFWKIASYEWSAPLRGLLPISCLVNRGTMGVNSLPKTYQTASQLRFQPGPFCAWVQHANHSATEPPLFNRNCVYRIESVKASRLTLIPPQLRLLRKSTGERRPGTAGYRSRKSSSVGFMSFSINSTCRVNTWQHAQQNAAAYTQALSDSESSVTCCNKDWMKS